MGAAETQLGDLPEECLALAIALTSPRDACRCAAVTPGFRAAADSDHAWRGFLPEQLLPRLRAPPAKRPRTNKAAYLGLCDAAAGADDDHGGRVWLDRASGARCYALPARALSLPWEDGEFSWTWTPHPRSRFGEAAELVDCTSMEIFGDVRSAALTPATAYAAYLVYDTAAGHKGLSYPDQEAAVSVGRRAAARHAVCLRPDEAQARKFWGAAGGGEAPRRPPRLREDGWWEMEMGRLRTASAGGEDELVEATFEVLGWHPKRGLIVEAIEFRPVH